MMMNLVGIKLLAEVPYWLLFTYLFIFEHRFKFDWIRIFGGYPNLKKVFYSVILQAQKQTSVV